MRYFFPILVLLSLILVGCREKENNTIVSSDARVSTFTFAKDTLYPGLTEGVYRIEHRSDTGLIYTRDSLRFGTVLDSVVPLVTYMATPGKVEFILPDTTIISTGVDTMNLNQRPIYLHVTASDMKNERWYRINIAAHKVNPDLYVWKKIADNIFPNQDCETKAFYINHQLVLYINNGLSTQVYKSANGELWEQIASTISTLPIPCHVRDICQHGDTLYYISDGQLYHSTDLLTWTKKDYSSNNVVPVNMLVSYNGHPWCLVQETTTAKMMLATIHKDSIAVETKIAGLKQGYLPTYFPISDFAALEFESSSERPRAMVVGGRDIDGNVVNSRWNIEYSTTDGYRLKDFSIAQPSFNSLTGASIIYYDKHFIMFGGIDNDLEWRSNILYSYDEGMNWHTPNANDNQLPTSYQTRQNQSVVVDTLDNIFIIGGQSNTEAFSDVYRGYLNSAKWE
jgi:hypothetical protein